MKHLSSSFMALLIPAFLLAGCAANEDVVPENEQLLDIEEDDTGSGADIPFTSTDIGYITMLHEAGEDGLRAMDIDLIEWYTGDDAPAAVKQDYPNCDPDCDPPNGYYIRNEEESPFTFDVANDVRVFLQTRNPQKIVTDEEVTYDEFLQVARDANGAVAQYWRRTPMWITHEDGVITEIKEQYIP